MPFGPTIQKRLGCSLPSSVATRSTVARCVCAAISGFTCATTVPVRGAPGRTVPRSSDGVFTLTGITARGVGEGGMGVLVGAGVGVGVNVGGAVAVGATVGGGGGGGVGSGVAVGTAVGGVEVLA